MVERRIDGEDETDETLVHSSRRAPVLEPDDDVETHAMYRLPKRTAVLKPPVNEGTEIMSRDQLAIPAVPVAGPAAPASLTVVDTQARPVDAAGFEQRYRQRAVLGVGGMGEVKLCKDMLIGREVALKVMHPGVSVGADARDRFVREARIQGQLEHPAVVPVYDIGVDPEGGVFFTMKRIRGMTLHSVLVALSMRDAEVTAKYSRRKLLTAFGSVCLAVDFAHRRGVLHRDLKPANIILGDFGEVYLLDWGLAKVAGSTDAAGEDALELTQNALHKTMHGALLGTPGYMSPEQARGELDHLDARSDVYALGAILFEILTGEPLHPQISAEEVILSTMRGVDARPSLRAKKRGDIPPELDAICVRATDIDPARRYASARALSDAIERFLDGDRNEELRRDLAKHHLAAAREALARAEKGGEAGQGARPLALREVGSALALDPNNPEALRTMARLLTEVPREVPPEAEAELEAAAAAARKSAARAGANRFLMWSAFVPLAFFMGIRHIPSATAAIAAIALCGAVAWWMSRRKTVTLSHGLALLVLSSATIGLMSGLFGPFILVPGQAATNTMFFSMSASRPGRLVVISIGVITVALPFFLEITGLLPPAYSFRGGILEVLPRATEFPSLQTMLCLFLTSVAMVVIPGLLAGRMRDALTAAERRLFLQSWQLRQLVPSEAQEALAAKKTA